MHEKMSLVNIEESFVQLPSGLLVSDWAAEDYYKEHRRPIGIDLFAGAGGMSLGMIQAGMEVVAGVDNDPPFAMTYMANLGTYPCQFHFVEPSDEKRLEKHLELHMKREKEEIKTPLVAGTGWIAHQPPDIPGVGHFFFGDIRKMSGRDILEPLGLERGEVDVVVGGPPCQGFSTAGKRNRMDPRSSLVFEFIRMVLEIKPKSMILENVPGMISMLTADGLPVVDTICRLLEDGGFGTYKMLLKSMQAQGAVGLLRAKPPDRVRKKKKRKKKTKRPKPRHIVCFESQI